MKKTMLLLFIVGIVTNLQAKEKILGSVGNTGRWVKIARIQNSNPINGGECSSISGTLNVQTDFGQTGSQQYYAIFSFGSRGGIKPLLREFGDAANRAATDSSRIEWRIYTDSQGWHYLWMWQSNFSLYAAFDFQSICATEYWTFETPPSDYVQIWSSVDGDRQYPKETFEAISVNGTIGIGTTNPGSYKLAVNGNIHAREVKVDLVGWPDYVFTKGYDLPPLAEVEKHILEKGHLINIPSAKEVEENGIQLGEMNKLLLEKIEELMLYTLQQQKEILLLRKQLKKVDALQEQINNLLNQNQE